MPARVHRVRDLADPRLDVYRNQKDAWLRASHAPDASANATGTGFADGLFMAEGMLVVEQLRDSPHELVSCLVDETKLDALTTLLDRADTPIEVFAGPRAMLSEIVGFAMHRGVLACGRAANAGTPESLAKTCRSMVILEDLANHDNVGGIFRSVAALAPSPVGIVLSPRCCDPLYRKSLRVSMGHALRVPFAWASDWPGDLRNISKAGVRVAALTTRPTAIPLAQAPFDTGRWAILAGSEGHGLTPEAIELADIEVRIPMNPGVDSLNVTVAASISLARFAS